MIIIGAGLSGLICGAMNPGSIIYERQKELPNNHGAVLRFRSDKIGRALNIPFKKVRVTKAIWFSGQEVQPTPRIQNMYSQKVTGQIGSRSISNIDPCDRYIAPPDFIQQLADRCNIVYNRQVNGPLIDAEFEPIVSTIPLPVMMRILDMDYNIDFARSPIWTTKFKLKNVDAYQTIYYPDLCPMYRASITGNELIVEQTNNTDVHLDTIIRSFGFRDLNIESETKISQKYGKIIPIDPIVSRSILAGITAKRNIYSLGRFATWRNILLDDVFEDVLRIQDLMKLDHYSRDLALAKE